MPGTPLVFLGTPGPAATVLEALIASGHRVVHVVTGADKRRGRGNMASPTPVKEVALRHGIEVSHDLTWFDGDVPAGARGIVVAYGRIIPAAVLAKVPMWNVHFSLLPRWRGAAPVARAILEGDARTGACIMEMEEGLDTGGVVGCVETDIGPGDTVQGLTDRLATMGAAKLIECLADPGARATPQHGETTYARKIAPEEGRIDWSGPAEFIDRQVRAVRAYTQADGRRLRIVELGTCDRGPHESATPGQVFDDGCVATGTTTLRLGRVQEEGRPVRSASEWLRGWRSVHRRLGGG